MKYIDATLTLKTGMRGVNIEPAKVLSTDGWNASNLQLYSHAGTHMDAPIHFEVNKRCIDDYPPERFFTTCYLVDLSGIEPGMEIGVSDLGVIRDQFQKGEGLIFRTGWSQKITQPDYRTAIPGISKELARWCANKGVATLGVEPPSVADLTDLKELAEIHKILLEADIVIVEGLANLEQVTKSKVQLVVLPLKIEKGDGAPCRAIIIE